MRYLLLLLAFITTANAFDNTLAPNGKIVLNMPPMGDVNAFSFMGEFGARVVRGSGTYGVYINPCDRINFTGELLLQDIRYSFAEGLREKWMTQYAVGAKYQHLFLYDFLESVEFAAAFSHSFKRTVRTAIPGRIAGTDAVESSFGPTINVWDCGYITPILNYDYVKYYRTYENKKVVAGFGGSFEYVQYLPLDFSLQFEADWRQPFHYFSGILNWHHDFSACGFDLGIYSNYTDGKEGLPNVYVGGIQLGLSFGPSTTVGTSGCNRIRPADKIQDLNSFASRCETTEFCDLSSWVSRPAIYMPVVLAIPDQSP